MVHVLRKVHTALRAGGVLLDVHPLPRHPLVAVWHGERRVVLGTLDDTVGIELIRVARRHLDGTVREGLFRVGGRRWFDGRMHYPSVRAWLRRREEYGSTAVIPPDLLRRVRTEMRKKGSVLVIGERVRATALRKLPTRRTERG